MKRFFFVLALLCAFGAARGQRADTLFFYNSDTASFNPAFLSLYSDGTFNYFQMPGGSCWATLDQNGTWTRNGDVIELHFPPRVATGNAGDTTVYDAGIYRLVLKDDELKCPLENSPFIVATLHTNESLERFFGK